MEAVDRRNPMLIRVATIADTEDHRLKVLNVLLSGCFHMLGAELVLNLLNLFFCRFTLTAGVQSMTTGWTLTVLTCTL